MPVATIASIQELPAKHEEVIGVSLSLSRQILENLFTLDDACIPTPELEKDRAKMIGVIDRISNAKTPLEKWDLYHDEYRPLSNQLKAKYNDFIPTTSCQKLEAYEKYVDGVEALIKAQGVMLMAFENQSDGSFSDPERQHSLLYNSMAELSNLAELYLPYFPQDLIEHIQRIALAFLNDPTFKPMQSSPSDLDLLYLTKNAARAVLWQIEEYRKDKKSNLGKPFFPASTFNRDLQIQKNQAAIAWAKSRLQEIEDIKK